MSAHADSDEVAQAFRDDVARCSDMMSPGGQGARQGDELGHCAPIGWGCKAGSVAFADKLVHRKGDLDGDGDAAVGAATKVFAK
jgi:hypothetical protein